MMRAVRRVGKQCMLNTRTIATSLLVCRLAIERGNKRGVEMLCGCRHGQGITYGAYQRTITTPVILLTLV
jgi:hypothetical protein